MSRYEDNRRQMLHNANAAAAALDHAAEQIRIATISVQQARNGGSSACGKSKLPSTPLIARFDQLATAFASWATVISDATPRMTTGSNVGVLLPKLHEFCQTISLQLSGDLQELTNLRNKLLSEAGAKRV